ncbi:MAG: prefoldin subunit alpha [archaeon]
MEENYILQLSLLEQQSQEIEKQINLVEQQINELQIFSLNLDKFKGEGEMLAPLGRGVFVKSEVKDKKLFVNIGSGVIVKKTPEEAKEIVLDQVNKLGNLRVELFNEIEKVNSELLKLIEKAQTAKK